MKRTNKQSDTVSRVSTLDRWFYVGSIVLLTGFAARFHEVVSQQLPTVWLLYFSVVAMNLLAIFYPRFSRNYSLVVHGVNIAVLAASYVPWIWIVIAIQSYRF